MRTWFCAIFYNSFIHIVGINYMIFPITSMGTGAKWAIAGHFCRHLLGHLKMNSILPEFPGPAIKDGEELNSWTPSDDSCP
jgi:hypothetical protein